MLIILVTHTVSYVDEPQLEPDSIDKQRNLCLQLVLRMQAKVRTWQI